MSDLMPKFCPHCLANFETGLVEIKTSNPPKCGVCLLPLWQEDRSGKTPDKPWPSYTALATERVANAGLRDAVESLRESRDSYAAGDGGIENLLEAVDAALFAAPPQERCGYMERRILASREPIACVKPAGHLGLHGHRFADAPAPPAAVPQEKK